MPNTQKDTGRSLRDAPARAHQAETLAGHRCYPSRGNPSSAALSSNQSGLVASCIEWSGSPGSASSVRDDWSSSTLSPPASDDALLPAARPHGREAAQGLGAPRRTQPGRVAEALGPEQVLAIGQMHELLDDLPLGLGLRPGTDRERQHASERGGVLRVTPKRRFDGRVRAQQADEGRIDCPTCWLHTRAKYLCRRESVKSRPKSSTSRGRMASCASSKNTTSGGLSGPTCRDRIARVKRPRRSDAISRSARSDPAGAPPSFMTVTPGAERRSETQSGASRHCRTWGRKDEEIQSAGQGLKRSPGLAGKRSHRVLPEHRVT